MLGQDLASGTVCNENEVDFFDNRQISSTSLNQQQEILTDPNKINANNQEIHLNENDTLKNADAGTIIESTAFEK